MRVLCDYREMKDERLPTLELGVHLAPTDLFVYFLLRTVLHMKTGSSLTGTKLIVSIPQ